MRGERFLELVTASTLVDPGELRRASRHDGGDLPEARKIAARLVQSGCLNQYQARELLSGNSRLRVDVFELRGFLGRGGTGNVYLAWDRERCRECALKVLAVDDDAPSRIRDRFRHEIELTSRMDHPNLAKAYRWGSSGSVQFLALEYVPGPTLYKWTKREGPGTIAQATRWIGQVARALDYAHQAGVVHRDLKPSNVILTEGGDAKLVVLGLARATDVEPEHDEGRVVGTFDYMAPEQTRDSKNADARSDVYGLCCLLYFSLCGEPPFGGLQSTAERIKAHRHKRARPIEDRRLDVPGGLAMAVQKAIAKAPEDRYRSAAEVAEICEYWAGRLGEEEERRSPVNGARRA